MIITFIKLKNPASVAAEHKTLLISVIYRQIYFIFYILWNGMSITIKNSKGTKVFVIGWTGRKEAALIVHTDYAILTLAITTIFLFVGGMKKWIRQSIRK